MKLYVNHNGEMATTIRIDVNLDASDLVMFMALFLCRCSDSAASSKSGFHALLKSSLSIESYIDTLAKFARADQWLVQPGHRDRVPNLRQREEALQRRLDAVRKGKEILRAIYPDLDGRKEFEMAWDPDVKP